MIRRVRHTTRIRAALTRSPIVSILGPRQSGKTTLARSIARGRSTTFFDHAGPRGAERW